MPPATVKTIRDLIYWEYANLIAMSAGLEKNYGFIMNRYFKLKRGEIKMSSLVRDDRKLITSERRCIYCGNKSELSFDHIIPLNRGGPDVISNQVLACKKCNSSKSDKDIFYWYGIERKEEVPKLVLSKYLKLVYDFHKKGKTLDKPDLNKDGKLDVMDLAIFKIR